MDDHGRRDFLLSAGVGLAAAGAAMAQTTGRPLTDKEKLDRLASNTWPIRQIFKTRSDRANPTVEAMKKKYGEITMLDFPTFTKETFPGVTRMDLFSGLFGDMADDSQYVEVPVSFNFVSRNMREFNPASPGGRKWLDRMASKMAATGTKCVHISNNAPRDICEPDEAKRKNGIKVAKEWLDAAAVLGAKSMRVNSGGPRIAPPAVATQDYPKADDLAGYLRRCIESFKEMADYGGKVGVKVTLENHWGLTANPTNIIIIINEVANPYCEASPDFCNWEHEYLLYNGLEQLAPYARTVVHAKYWNRWKDPDVRRNVRIMAAARFPGVYALEYEDGPWDGVEGAKYLYKEVLAAL
jgi:sugar phosphate isomerase/epimerase